MERSRWKCGCLSAFLEWTTNIWPRKSLAPSPLPPRDPPGAVVTRRQSVHGNHHPPTGFPSSLQLPPPASLSPPANRMPASPQRRPLSGPWALTSQAGEAGPGRGRSSEPQRVVGVAAATPPSPPPASLPLAWHP